MNYKMQEEDRQLALLGAFSILTHADLTVLCESERRVYELMKDGDWHSAEQIEAAAGSNGIPAREGLRRMRELRRLGFRIDRERAKGLRQFRYRLSREVA